MSSSSICGAARYALEKYQMRFVRAGIGKGLRGVATSLEGCKTLVLFASSFVVGVFLLAGCGFNVKRDVLFGGFKRKQHEKETLQQSKWPCDWHFK